MRLPAAIQGRPSRKCAFRLRSNVARLVVEHASHWGAQKSIRNRRTGAAYGLAVRVGKGTGISADFPAHAALPSSGSPFPPSIVSGPPAEPPTGPWVEYPSASPPSCESGTPINEHDVDMECSFESSPDKVGQTRTIAAKRAAVFRLRTRFTAIQNFCRARLTAQRRQFGTS